jgi:hypothetical protein
MKDSDNIAKLVYHLIEAENKLDKTKADFILSKNFVALNKSKRTGTEQRRIIG